MREECRNHLQQVLVAPLRHVWSSVIIVLRGRGIEHRKSFVPSFLPSFQTARSSAAAIDRNARRSTRNSLQCYNYTQAWTRNNDTLKRETYFSLLCELRKMFSPIYDFHIYPSCSPPQTNHTTVTELGNSRRSSALT